jgi:predicted nucleotidyltransferase
MFDRADEPLVISMELLTSAVARERAERASRALAADPRVRLVFLFGSAADPDRQVVGDVDLAVLTAPALTLREQLRLGADATLGRRGERGLLDP